MRNVKSKKERQALARKAWRTRKKNMKAKKSTRKSKRSKKRAA